MRLSKHYLFIVKSCLLLLACCSFHLLSGQETNNANIIGDWAGAIEVQGNKLNLVLHIEEKEGKLNTSIDIPLQGVKDFAASSTSLEGQKLKVDFTAFQAIYSGTLEENGKVITGAWKQNGMEFALVLNRSTGETTINRPQEPKAPFPYTSEDVVYPNKEANIELAGTLTLPRTPPPYAVAILISGSGPQNRNEELMGHKPFLVLSDYLTRNGIAVLRYDDRGIGKSTGNFQSATSLDFSKDVIAGIDYLKTRKDIDAKKIGLIGHSEGGLIAPMIASQSDELAFIALLAGPGIKCDELLIMQGELIGKSMGSTDEDLAKRTALNHQIYELVKADHKPMLRREKMIEILKPVFDAMTDEEKAQQGGSVEMMTDAMLSQVGGPWFKYFLNFDPTPYLTKVKCPTLAINGGKDLQVPAEINLQGIEAALTEAPCEDFEIKMFPQLNHLFQTAETGAIAEYAEIEETFSPEALTYLKDWIIKRIK